MSDSLYVTTMSKTELLGPMLRTLPPSWYPLWVSDNEAAKSALGSKYKLAKVSVLALLYGLSPNGLVRQFSDNGVTLTLAEAERLYNTFWASIPQVREFRDIIVKCFSAKFRKKEPFLTPFGFPAPSGKPKDGMNRVIQSSVSSFVRSLWEHMFPNQCGAELVCVVHDEIIVEVPENRIEDYRTLLNNAVDLANKKFELKFPLRLGFNVGDNLYEIH
jgi:DNA polymerase-1